MSGINVLDPLPYVMAMAFFAAVVALSILAPGRRATRIDPLPALSTSSYSLPGSGGLFLLV